MVASTTVSRPAASRLPAMKCSTSKASFVAAWSFSSSETSAAAEVGREHLRRLEVLPGEGRSCPSRRADQHDRKSGIVVHGCPGLPSHIAASQRIASAAAAISSASREGQNCSWQECRFHSDPTRSPTRKRAVLDERHRRGPVGQLIRNPILQDPPDASCSSFITRRLLVVPEAFLPTGLSSPPRTEVSSTILGQQVVPHEASVAQLLEIVSEVDHGCAETPRHHSVLLVDGRTATTSTRRP